MFRSHIITALRGFARHRLYTIINVAGLSVGLACAVFIALFLRDELSYDRWIPDSSNLYRLELTFHMRGRAPWPLATAPLPVLDAMQAEIPEVTGATHLVPEGMTVAVGDRRFYETIAVVDPGFFQVIKLPLLQGDPAAVFAQPESIVVSQSTARKFFGDVDPVGKTVTVTGDGILCDRNDSACLTASHLLTVTGVMRDLPSNTQLVADILLPNSSLADGIPKAFRKQSWTSTNGSYDYVKLAPGVDPKTVLEKLKPILDRSIRTGVTTGVDVPGSEFEEFHLTRFWDVHLTSDSVGGMKPAGSFTTVYGFAVIAALILLIACFNFMNLATARATLRAREISLRKVVGATRRELIVQLMGEAVLMSLAALFVALALVEILLPVFDRFLDRPISFHYLTDWPLTVGSLVTALAAGLLSGVYPAFVLSSFRPAGVLNSNAATSAGGGLLRVALVIAQFAVSIGLGVAAIVVFSQVRFARNVDLGFDRAGVVVVRGITKLTPSAADNLARVLRSDPGISEVTLSDGVPFDLFNVSNVPVQIQGESQSFTAHILDISPEFPSLYDMRLVAGRLLSAQHGEDVFTQYPFFSSAAADAGRNVLINEVAARRFGYGPQDVIGKTIVAGSGRVTIAGVVGDSKLDGLRETVQATVYVDYPPSFTLLSIRLRGGARLSETLGFIDRTWRSFSPGSAVQRYFLNDTFDQLFKSDEKQGEMFGVFVGIAIFIACLGLFGLAAFTAQRRTKEIGVRKVFGARTSDIVLLLLWRFSIPVLIANAVAWPVAFYYLHHWLESYAYRIPLNPLYFLSAGAIALGIAWATVLAHALRVARASPIHALRYE
ncbi:MAG TPA: ABC transporter permease [Xanthobacteraceae bacterium]|jgi:putative ABC transport system permease protein